MVKAIHELADAWAPSGEGCDVYLALEYEPWEIDEVLRELSTEGTVWKTSDFKIEGCKSYDEYGNSEVIGILVFNIKGKSKADIYQLAVLWEDALDIPLKNVIIVRT